MRARSSWIDGSTVAAIMIVIAILAVPEPNARAAHGGRGGRGARAPRVSAPRGGFQMPRMPRIQAPARASVAHAQTHTNRTHAVAGHAQPHANTAQAPAHNSQKLAMNTAAVSRRAVAGTVNPGNRNSTGTARPGTTGPLKAGAALASPINPSGLYGNTYTYGYGSHARRYRAYGYGSGYRNRYYGRRYGYGRSQGYNRAIIARLRSVHAQLARIDHDYQGHRVRAMHAVAMAIRQLSHRSMIYSGVGFAPGMNNGRGMGMGQGGIGGRGGARRMSQAQSDARMSHSLRTLQGVNMQLGSQGSSTTGHARAHGHVMQAVHELSVALSIR